MKITFLLFSVSNSDYLTIFSMLLARRQRDFIHHRICFAQSNEKYSKSIQNLHMK